MIAQGRFREDLYYRLAEIVVTIPPLRSRKGDAVLLAHAFARQYAQEQKRGSLTLLADALGAIEAHAWPGNVRELQNCVKRAVIMADGNVLTAADFGLAAAAEEPRTLRDVRDEAERDAVVRVLSRANGNLSRAAELLGVSRPTLYDLLNRFGLKEAPR
jgi:two-component system NtrC family response regulator